MIYIRRGLLKCHPFLLHNRTNINKIHPSWYTQSRHLFFTGQKAFYAFNVAITNNNKIRLFAACQQTEENREKDRRSERQGQGDRTKKKKKRESQSNVDGSSDDDDGREGDMRMKTVCRRCYCCWCCYCRQCPQPSSPPKSSSTPSIPRMPVLNACVCVCVCVVYYLQRNATFSYIFTG